jgi:predicted metal-dependent hydrolase
LFENLPATLYALGAIIILPKKQPLLVMTDAPLAWLQGIQEFNAREYYACHDTLEALWMDSVDPDKKFYQGVLQIAVACYHLHNRNWRGAVTLLGEGIGRLPYYQPVYAGIDVIQLIQDSRNLLNALQSIGTDGIDDFVDRLSEDSRILPMVNVVGESTN